jgi:vesicle-fusing ATPase
LPAALLLQVVSPENLVGFMEQPKASNITKVFEDAYKSPLSIVILVGVHQLCSIAAAACAFYAYKQLGAACG